MNGLRAISLEFIRRRRLAIEVRQHIGLARHLAVILAALCFGLGISIAILVGRGVEIDSIYEEFVVFTFFNAAGISAVVVESIPLVLVGLGAAMAFRVNFWNIGIEGQMFMGAIGASIIALFDIGPGFLRLPLMLLFSVLFGMLWALGPAILKVRLNVNEIISTLLLNYIAYYFALNQLFGPWKDPRDKFPHGEQYELSERLPEIGWEQVHYGIVVAAIAVVLVWWAVDRSRFGITSRFVGVNPRMALVVGLPVSVITAGSALASGGLAGSAGFVIAAATEYRLTFTMAAGYGFSGIVIAFLAGNRPIPTLIVAFLMGSLYVAGESMKIFYSLPDALVGLIQAIIVLSVIASEFFVRYRLRLAHFGSA